MALYYQLSSVQYYIHKCRAIQPDLVIKSFELICQNNAFKNSAWQVLLSYNMQLVLLLQVS